MISQVDNKFCLLNNIKDPHELDTKISHLKDETFHVEQLIAKSRHDNSDLDGLNNDKRVSFSYR